MHNNKISTRNNFRSQQDDWDNVHQQMLAVQKKSDPIIQRQTEGSETTSQKTMASSETTLDEAKVKTAAWKIIDGYPKVKNALMFYGGISSKNIVEEGKRDAELKKFSVGGANDPIVSFDTDHMANTDPTQTGAELRKKIQINPNISFSVAVSRFLHELTHYIDLWYSSDAAGTLKKDRAEGMSSGVEGIGGSLSVPEQLDAFGEYINPMVEQMLIDMQATTPVAFEHPKVPTLRKELADWKALPENSGKDQKEFVKLKRKALRDDIKESYKTWEVKKDVTQGGALYSMGVELGYAFDKAAHGFFETHKEDWAKGFDKRFEETYPTELKQE